MGDFLPVEGSEPFLEQAIYSCQSTLVGSETHLTFAIMDSVLC